MKNEVRTKFNKNNGNGRGRKQKTIITYVKKVHGLLDLDKEIEDLANVHPVIGTCIGGKAIITLTEMREEMVKEFLANQPDMVAGENMFWQIEASSSKCILKTSSNISFGYRFKYKKNEDVGDKFVIDLDAGIEFTVVLFRENELSEKKLVDAGYEKVDAAR